MTIYAKGERWTLYLGDARDVLSGFETESFDLVVTDPPYGVEWRSNVRAERFEGMANDGADERGGVREIGAERLRKAEALALEAERL